MAPAQFVHLHLHTQYSLLDGVNKIPGVLEEAHALGQPAIAMTDHGNLHGAIEFYLAGKKIGIKPIIGCELYVHPVSRRDRTASGSGNSGARHLTVLARDIQGYQSLCRLVSRAYREGFYFKPRVDHELLAEHNAGLIVLSGCISGELGFHAKQGNVEAARRVAEFYAKLLPDRYYLEIQPHAAPEQRNLNALCCELAAELGLPLVATTDCHYPRKDDHYAQEVLMCVSTGKRIADPDHMRHEGFDLHLKSAEEMRAQFGDLPQADEAIANSLRIAEQCGIEFNLSTYYMPQFKAADERPLIEVMAEAARQGLERRLSAMERSAPEWLQANRERYYERLEREIPLIDTMGFAGYFLVVADFIVWAKEQGIPVGPGRGSAAGSLVAYAMRITEVDPIRNKLLFERFLNPNRISLPDIDVDFCIFGRDRVIKYVSDKYGHEKVAQIATFGTLKAKAALKDVGRVLGVSYAETDRVAQLIPAPRQGFDYSLEEAIKMEPRLAAYAENEGRELIDLARKLEGLTRHSSTHAAGVVIGDRPLDELLPMMVDKDGNDVTQFSMNFVEKIGLVKFDFLGLKTLTVIHTALRLIKESRGVQLALEELPLDDPETYALLCAGNTTGVFQLESSGITDMTMRLKPNGFDDLVAILALYRPGPLDAGMVDHYIERKHGREPVTYLHPLMKEVLEDTYGIMLYQEQIMQLVQVLAGYTLGEADLLRKAMGKKIAEEMARQRERFLAGAAKNGIGEKLAVEIFGQMETFARYGFNRSHSAAYALISFQTAYLKAHYGVEFMAALMSHEMEDSDKTLKNLNECRKQKIEILPPDVNNSLSGFSVRGGRIRYGLSAVKGVGEKAVAAVVEAREQDGAFQHLEDFAARVDLRTVNKRVVENLIKCGAFDFSSVSRREMMERVDEVLRAGQALQRQDDGSQISLFAAAAQAAQRAIPRRQSNKPEWPVNRKLAFEREALGFYISGHPLEKFKSALKRLGAVTTAELRAKQGQSEAVVGGVVTGLRLKNTKRGDRYATFTLEDYLGTVESIVWPDVYRQTANLLVADEPIVATGRPDITDERCTLVVEKLESLIDLRDRNATQGLLRLNGRDDVEHNVDKLLTLVTRHSGRCPLKLVLEIDGAEVSLALRTKENRPVCVVPSEALCDEVEQLFGRPVLFFQ